MATVTKSTPVGNPKSLSEQFNSIVSNYAGWPLHVLERSVQSRRDALFSNLGSSIEGLLRSELVGTEKDLSAAKCFHDLASLSPQIFVADQLKQDHDHVLNQLAEAVEDAIINDTLPDEVQIEIQGDIIIPSAILDNCRVEFERMDEGEAVYSVHCI